MLKYICIDRLQFSIKRELEFTWVTQGQLSEQEISFNFRFARLHGSYLRILITEQNIW